MQKNLTKQQNFKLKLLEIKKVGWSKMVLKGTVLKKGDGPPWFLRAQFFLSLICIFFDD